MNKDQRVKSFKNKILKRLSLLYLVLRKTYILYPFGYIFGSPLKTQRNSIGLKFRRKCTNCGIVVLFVRHYWFPRQPGPLEPSPLLKMMNDHDHNACWLNYIFNFILVIITKPNSEKALL